MANPNITKAAHFFNLLLLFPFLFAFIHMVQSRSLGVGLANSAPVCDLVFGAQSGDTCFSVTQMFNLTADFFGSISPNLECHSIFVGQWLCIDGAAN